jgi:hypothetical protein
VGFRKLGKFRSNLRNNLGKEARKFIGASYLPRD